MENQNISEISKDKRSLAAYRLICECEKTAQKLGITPEKAYEIYLKKANRIQVSKQGDPGWHKKLPEYYIVEGHANSLEKMFYYAEKGISQVEILQPDEYKYLMKKESLMLKRRYMGLRANMI